MPANRPYRGPSLESGRRAVERLMEDTMIMVRDPRGAQDETFSAATGQIGSPAGTRNSFITYDETAVGNGQYGSRALFGKCLVVSLRDSQPRFVTESLDQVDSRFMKIMFPIDAALPAIGDRCFVTQSRRSVDHVGRVYEVREVIQSTFPVAHTCVVTPYQWNGAGTPPSAQYPGADVMPYYNPGFTVLEATVNLLPGRAVRLTGTDTIGYYDSTDVLLYGELFGVTTEPIGVGQRGAVCVAGRMVVPGSGWTPGAAYFANGTQGEISTVPPVVGVLQMVGTVPVPTTDTMNVILGQPVLL